MALVMPLTDEHVCQTICQMAHAHCGIVYSGQLLTKYMTGFCNRGLYFLHLTWREIQHMNKSTFEWLF